MANPPAGGDASLLNPDSPSVPPECVPVLVVGGGPTGLLISFMLSRFGIRSTVVEKYTSRLLAPKAHALSPRTLEICRQYGFDTMALRALGTQRKDAYWVQFLTSLSGERIGVLPYERMDSKVLDHTPEMIHNIPQPLFEDFIAKELANQPCVDIRKGIAYVDCVQDRDGVLTTVEDRASKARYQIRSRHVIGCDGAKSEVRKSLSIECEGEDSYETMMTIHIKADLRPIVKERVGMLHWILDPSCSGFIIAYDLADNQVLITNFNPKWHPLATWDDALARSVVMAAIGQRIPFQVLSFRPWVLSRKVAKQFRHGNVFLAGDAAHPFPPTGGLGLNTGVADVHNLAYKIAAVHKSCATEAFLSTFELERRPPAVRNAAQSLKNGKEIFSFLKNLGVAETADVEEARQALYSSICNPSMGQMIAEHIEGQREHFDNLGLHIGHVYGSNEAPANASLYVPKFVPGARLPHAWIAIHSGVLKEKSPIDVSYVAEFTPAEVEERRFSILDLCSYHAFTIFVAHKNEWVERYQEAAHHLLLPAPFALQIFACDSDFTFVSPEHAALFEGQGGLGNGGGLLVRPDQHILSRLSQHDSAETIQAAISSHLCPS